MNTTDYILDDLMDNGFEYDLNDYMTDRQQAELLGEVLATMSQYKDEKSLTYLENKHEKLTLVRECIEDCIRYFVELKND